MFNEVNKREQISWGRVCLKGKTLKSNYKQVNS